MSFIKARYELYTHRPTQPRSQDGLSKLASLYRASNVCTVSCVTTVMASQSYCLAIRKWSSAANLPFKHSCLTAVHKDGLGSSQDLPSTVGPLQLWPYRVMQVIDYEGTIFSSRWVVQGPTERGQWVYYVPYPYPIVFILFVHLGVAVVCATRCYVDGDGRW